LLESGQINKEVFVLIKGRLLVRLPDSEAVDAILIDPGGSIGEMSIIDNKPVSARVEAADSCTLAVISAHVFWDVLMPVSGFARNVMRQLSERMRSSNEIIVERMRERIALEQLQKELAVARNIQSSMLPPRGSVLVEGGRAAVYGLMDPARDIGGDFYDAFMIDERHLLMMVGDVSGKGVPAALFMARAVAVLRAEAVRVRARPAALLERVNTLLCANNETGMFVTLLVASLDLETGELHYANAGHLAPALRRADGATSWLPLPAGALVGVLEGAKYGAKVLRLSPGDTVLLYTDGVTEAMDGSSVLFGDDRLLRALSEAPGYEVAQMAEHVRSAIAGFVNGAATADDITMLAVRRN
jgi:sigma-B regulation protein RsbU (phosphoserine phosphatase)